MMLVDTLILTVKDEDGVIINRHFDVVEVQITSDAIGVFDKHHKPIVIYSIDNVLYMQTQGNPKNFRLFQ